jgi:hypothetical protein
VLHKLFICGFYCGKLNARKKLMKKVLLLPRERETWKGNGLRLLCDGFKDEKFS